MYGLRGLVMGMLLTVAFGGCARTPPPPTTTSGFTSTATGGSREQEIRTTALVEHVDQATRLVTLRRSDGDTVTVRAGQEVRNLPQLKRGDRVVVVSYNAIAFEVLKQGERKLSLSADDDVFVAAPGEKPRGGSVRETTLVARITKLDRATQQVTLRGPRKKRVTLKVLDPENFDKVKVGDTVEITYTEAYAIEVQPK